MTDAKPLRKPRGVARVFFQEILEGDRRKLEARSNDDPGAGGGARDLRVPHKAFGPLFKKFFPNEVVKRRRRGGQPTDVTLQGGEVVWIEKGILRNLSYTRFWAQKQGAQPTGPVTAGGLRLDGGTKTTEELIAGCERGILVTHFFYIRALDPRTVLQTGLTRDGTFLIENGKVTTALKNFRWNESPLLMLNRLEEIGRAEPTGAGRMMPALRVRDFEFTSLSDAV